VKDRVYRMQQVGEKVKRKYKPLIASTDLIGCINWAKVRHFLLPATNGDVGVDAGCGPQLMKVHFIV
jgi:hypothetical protein